MPCACGKHKTLQGCAGAKALSQLSRAAKQAGGRKSRANFSLRYRSRLFRQKVDQLTATGKIRKEDLLAAFMDVYTMGRNATKCRRWHERKRQQEGQAA